MWRARVFTLYPEMFPGPLDIGLTKKHVKKNYGHLKLLILGTMQKINIKQ